MKAKRQTAIRTLQTMMVVTVIVPLALFAVAAWQQHDVIGKLADDRIDRTLDIVAEHAKKIFRTVEVVFGSVDEITRDRSDETLRSQEAELHDRLKLMATAVVDIQSLWVFDANGGAIASSTNYPVPPFNNSDRDYFQAQLHPNAGTYIGKVLTTKLTGDVFFSISRRRVRTDASFAGVTAVAVLPSAFENFYRPLARETVASFAMIRADGAVLARYPIATTPGIMLDENSGFRRTIAAQPGGGKYTTVSGVDGIERRFSVRRLGDLPVYATASLEYSTIRGEWLWWMGKQLAFGIPTVLLLLALEYITLRRTDEFYLEVTRRELAESTARQSQKMEAVGQLTGGIAHDFNNLLTIIIGNLESLGRQLPEGSKLHRKLLNAMTGAERAAQLTHRLLAFSRRQPLDPKPIDANELISRASELLSRSLGEQVQLETVRGAGLWMTEVDPAELEGSIINLAINARDAMPHGGKITVETSNAFLDDAYCDQHQGVSPGQYVMIAVTDNGSGMSPQTIEHAFEPFFTTKEPGLGTGLGLSQVYGFVKQSSGHIGIYSEIGHGTTVKMYLPRSYETPPDGAQSVSSEIKRGNREVILVVEDDAAVRNYVLELLLELNYDARAAEGGEAAAAILNDEGQKIDLLLTDVVMPGMNGRQVAELAMAKRPGLRVLYMTGYSRDAIVHQGRLDAGVSLIQKPLTELDLSIRIRSLLDRA